MCRRFESCRGRCKNEQVRGKFFVEPRAPERRCPRPDSWSAWIPPPMPEPKMDVPTRCSSRDGRQNRETTVWFSTSISAGGNRTFAVDELPGLGADRCAGPYGVTECQPHSIPSRRWSWSGWKCQLSSSKTAGTSASQPSTRVRTVATGCGRNERVSLQCSSECHFDRTAHDKQQLVTSLASAR